MYCILMVAIIEIKCIFDQIKLKCFTLDKEGRFYCSTFTCYVCQTLFNYTNKSYNSLNLPISIFFNLRNIFNFINKIMFTLLALY